MSNPGIETIKSFADAATELYKIFFKKYPAAKLLILRAMMQSSGNIGIIIMDKSLVVGKFTVYTSSEGNIVRSGIGDEIYVSYILNNSDIIDIISNKREYLAVPWKLFKYSSKLVRPSIAKTNPFYQSALMGERVFLRPYMESDMPYLLSWYNDYELNRLAGWTGSRIGEARLKYNYSKSYGYDPMNLIIDDENGKPIGTVQLYDFSDFDKSCKLGIRIGDKSCWSKGYGMDAVNTILEHAFMKMDQNRVALRVYEYNERAVKCYEKSGFKHEGRARKSAFIDGSFYDEVLMGILKSEYIEMKDMRSR